MPVSDVSLSHTSHISDEEEYRFQMPVAVYGHRAYQWGRRDLTFRRNVRTRLINVGPARLVERGGSVGYPVCLVCGQSRSPFASAAELTHFRTDHQQRCGRVVESIGFYTVATVDTLTIRDCADSTEAYSIAEALRAGAARVLDMERDDLDLVVIRQPGSPRADALLFDPMPGGSGLLEQIRGNFGMVADSARAVAHDCTAVCAESCVDCL